MSTATFAPSASATSVLTVCPTGCPYPTIQAAIAAASPGDTILVEPGEYAGPVNVPFSLTICSTTAGGFWCDPQPETTSITGGGLYPVFIQASFVTFEGFTVQNPDMAFADQDFGIVDPSLVVVYGDHVRIAENVLQKPAAPPGPGRTRWFTIGVNIGTGSDHVTVERNVIHDFVAGIGPGGLCPQPPCKVIGILNWGDGSVFFADENVIDLSGTSVPAAGVRFRNAAAFVRDNTITMPGSAPGSDPVSIGIDGGISHQATVTGNRIEPAVSETPFGLYGIYGIFSGSYFGGNRIERAQHGLMLRSSAVGGNVVTANLFLDGNQGILSYAQGTDIQQNSFARLARGVVLDRVEGDPAASTGVRLNLNSFEEVARPLTLTETVTGVFVDARRNDWGAYGRDVIEARNDDATGTNEIDVSCFIDEDGFTQVCPSAAIGSTTLNTAWPRSIRLDDVSLEGGRDIVEREWTLPDGTSPTTASVTRSFAPGNHLVRLRVTDSEGFSDEAETLLALTNAAPTLAAPATASVQEGSTLAFVLAGADADGDTLTFSMSGAPPGATLSASTGAFSYAPAHDAAPASFAVVFTATDGAASASASTTLTVGDTPVPPALSPPGSRSTLEQGVVTVGLVASDPNGGIVTFASSALPAGATLVDHGDNRATFSWTPPIGSAGVHSVPFTATAANGLFDTQTLTITVTQAGALTLVRGGGAIALTSPGETLVLSATLTNAGTGPDAFVLSASGPWGPEASPGPTLAPGASATVTATVTAPPPGGTASVALRACSAAQPSVCKTVSWSVRTPLLFEVDMPPSFAATDEIAGTARVTWLNGAPAVGATVSLVHQARALPAVLRGSASAQAGADGTAVFVLDDAAAGTPGDHDVFATARLANNEATGRTAYTVTT